MDSPKPNPAQLRAAQAPDANLPLVQALAGKLPPLGVGLPLVATVLLGGVALAAAWLGAIPNLLPFVIIVTATASLHLVGASLVRRNLWPHVVNPALRLVNLTATTAAVLFSGGLSSPLILLYMDEIVSASLRDGRYGARKGWALVTLALFVVALFAWPPTEAEKLRLLVYVSVMGVIALIVGRMGQQRIEIQAALAQQTLENVRLLENVQEQAARLAREKSKLDAMLRNIADGLVVTDTAGQILLVNPAFETLFGRPAADLVGRPLSQAIADRALREAIARALQGQSTNPITDLALADGRTLRASSACIREGDEGLGVVTVLRDITHEVALDRMKTDFVSLVSHEVRTPLTSVLGFAKLIQKSFAQHIAPQIPLSDHKSRRAVRRIHDNLDIIVSEGERLTRLINQVLDIAKMEAGEATWHMETSSITEAIHQAVAATSALAQAKGLKVWLDLERGLPPVRADQDRLVQVLTNLLSNAVKFSDHGQIEVQAGKLRSLGDSDGSSPPNLPPGDWLVVSVHDSGVGIAPADLSQVFEKFKQVQDTIGNRPKGTGLGLPICKEIVEQHGGQIWAESELGVGSRFSFALPVEPAVDTIPPR